MSGEIILHHYPQSPMAEKVRVAFGLKNLSWRSVTVPRIPPKDKLFALTGGFRRVPVMQIGANIYCDTLCILRAIEQKFPSPSLTAQVGSGLGWTLSRWIDDQLFRQCLVVVLGHQADTLPEDFARDRGRLYFGPDYDLEALRASIPAVAADIRAGFAMLGEAASAKGPFFFGQDPSIVDIYIYYIMWFLRGRWDQGATFLSQFERLEALEEAVAQAGHGHQQDMTDDQALTIAKEAGPDIESCFDGPETQNIAIGQTVGIQPTGDGGDPIVTGTLAALNATEVAILRTEDQYGLGELCLYFPRSNYVIHPDVE